MSALPGRGRARGGRRDAVCPAGDIACPGGPAPQRSLDPAPAADDQMIAAQRLQRAQSALAALGSRVEMVFRRFRLEGVGQRDIAQELGVSLTTVEKDLQKAYRAMTALRQDFDTEDR